MAGRLLVAAAVVLVLVAAADAWRSGGRAKPEPVAASLLIDRGPAPCRSLRPFACGEFTVSRGTVRRRGQLFLDRFALYHEFPGRAHGRVIAERLARAADGTLAIGVRDTHGRSAVELWRGRTPLASFRVPAGAYADGLAFEHGTVLAFGVTGAPAVYDRRGRRV